MDGDFLPTSSQSLTATPATGYTFNFRNVVIPQGVTVRGALEWSLPIYPDTGNRTSQYSKQQMIFDWVQAGKLHIEPLISHRLPPEEIKQAYEGLLRQTETYTGVALVWQ